VARQGARRDQDARLSGPRPNAVIFQRLADRLADIRRKGLLRRRFAREGAQGPRISVDGREFLAFCSNDYLGLANHPRIVQAAVEAAERHGVGEGASHLLSGHSIVHQRLESAPQLIDRLAALDKLLADGVCRATLQASDIAAKIGDIGRQKLRGS